MKIRLIVCLLFLCFQRSDAQIMRPVEELLDKSNTGWLFVSQWINSARNKVEVLAADSNKARIALYNTQVSTRSSMGAVVYMTGGILVDNGWIRILGSGSDKMKRSLPDWNKGRTYKETGDAIPYLLIADDAIGGFFLLNGGGLGKDMGKVYYFSPDNLQYEAMGITYSEFLSFCFNGDLDTFYSGYRWQGWRSSLDSLEADSVYNFYPPLWSEEGKAYKSQRSEVPVAEQYILNMSLRRRFGFDK